MKLPISLGLAAGSMFMSCAHGDIPWEFGSIRSHAHQAPQMAAAPNASPTWMMQYMAAPAWGGMAPAAAQAGPAQAYPGNMGTPACYASWMGGNPMMGCY
jgi:hypothetical protein